MGFKYLLMLALMLLITTSLLWTDSGEDQLILYVSQQNTAVNQVYLDKYSAFAEKNETKPVIRYIEESGAPFGITVTPSIIYQNAKGFSMYYGRYRNFGRLKTFVRKSRLKLSQNSVTPKKDILQWQDQRASITAPLKITAIESNQLSAADQQKFEQSAKTCFAKGMRHFELLPTFEQRKTNRAFYIDIHPHLSPDKMLTLKAEIYSQFNCIRPVYEAMREPLVQGKWKNRRQLLETAAGLLELEIQNIIHQSEKGDDFVAIPLSTATGEWRMEITEDAIKRNNNPKSEIIPSRWQVKPSTSTREPVGAFSFKSPLDGYAGEIKQLDGTLSLNDQGGLSNAQGQFAVAIQDISMGDNAFDKEVRYKMLNMEQFPQASFQFTQVSGSSGALRLYREEQCTVEGVFKMKGYEIPVTVPATIELRLDAEGGYLLHVLALFNLNLFDDFKVEGPDGPSPAKDVLEFVLKFDLMSEE